VVFAGDEIVETISTAKCYLSLFTLLISSGEGSGFSALGFTSFQNESNLTGSGLVNTCGVLEAA
jgi:hypothetical protein